jgi:hypothetical protein
MSRNDAGTPTPSETPRPPQQPGNIVPPGPGAPGPIVEDVTVQGGIDRVTGEGRIVPKPPAGRVNESVIATDPRER